MPFPFLDTWLIKKVIVLYIERSRELAWIYSDSKRELESTTALIFTLTLSRMLSRYKK